MSVDKQDVKSLLAILLNKIIGKHSVDMQEVTADEAYRENQKDNCGNPIVVNAMVRCSKMKNKDAKAFVIVKSPTYNERNGGLGIRDIDIIMTPNTFGICEKHQSICHPVIEAAQWQGCDQKNKISGSSHATMFSYMVCTNGGGIITPVTDGQKESDGNSYNQKLVEQAYETMQNWLLGGERAISKEELDKAIDILATYGEQSSISRLNDIPDEDIEKETDKVRKEMLDRINKSIPRQEQYDNMILAWTNYWNMTMQKQYGEYYSPIRAEVVKALLVDESNMGQENCVERIIQNGQRDIMQSLDPRNPIIWAVLNTDGGEKKFTIEYAGNDVRRLGIEETKTITQEISDGGYGNKIFYGSGTWGAAKELFSDDFTTYYAGEVTPELSLAVGVSTYCLKLNGAGMDGANASYMRDEATAVYKYNGEGDSQYVDKINIVLDNMGVELLEKKD